MDQMHKCTIINEKHKTQEKFKTQRNLKNLRDFTP